MPLQVQTKTLSGIVFGKATIANFSLSENPSAPQVMTDVIKPVSLAAGKISVAQGSFDVYGTGTQFRNDFNAGDFIYYYNVQTLSPVFLGQVNSVLTDSQIQLDNASAVAITNGYCGGANTVLSTNEDIIMQVPVVFNSVTQACIPNWNQWRSPNTLTSPNNPVTNKIERISAVNDPTLIISTPENVQYFIDPITDGWPSYIATTGVAAYFRNSSDLPKYAYAALRIYGNASTNLAPNALFKIFAQPSFTNNCVIVSPGTSGADLKAAGYNSVDV
jgi:hypothetical protein